MSDVRQSLIGAVYGILTADANLGVLLDGGEVLDHVPRGARFPFISFGDGSTRAVDGDDTPSELHRFEVMVHSRAPGRAEASAIAARVETLLDGAAPALTGASVVFLRLRDTAIAASRDRRAYRARLRFEALTETT